MWMDYGQPKKDPGLDAYADAVARFAQQAYQSITYHDWVSLAMAETKIVLGRRVPDEARLAWAKAIVDRMGSRDIPNSLPEVYAKEAIFLHDEPRRELKLQAIRIGELGIAAIPNEVFAITGLKIKAQSPFETTMNIELANGSEGYIPPPEQHALGGYTTWPARTAGLEVQAEPKIVEAVLGLLEQVAGKPRRRHALDHGPYAKAVLASKPLAYWRLDEMKGPAALDSSGQARHGKIRGRSRILFARADAAGLSAGKPLNRAVHFAGGRLKAELDALLSTYTVELWFWNGLPNDARPITGVFLSFGTDGAGKSGVDDFGIGGTQVAASRLFFAAGPKTARFMLGSRRSHPRPGTISQSCATANASAPILTATPSPRSTSTPGSSPARGPAGSPSAARTMATQAFEGKIDEVAVYDRRLPFEEIVTHFARPEREPA